MMTDREKPGVAMEARLIQEWTQEERQAAAVKIDEIIESQQFAVETIGNHGYTPGIIDLQCENAALHETIATLREVHAEEVHTNELLGTEISELRADLAREREDNTHEVIRGVALRYKERLEKAESELARERERHQELRQVVKEYKRSCKFCYDVNPTLAQPLGRRVTCYMCLKADLLLAPAPVATGESK